MILDDPARPPILYFGNDWFAENRTSSHHIARRLARQFALLYVEVPGLRSPKATSRDVGKLWRKLALSLLPPRRIGAQMWHATLPQIPFRRLPFVARVNRWIAERLVKRAVRALGFRKPLVWSTVPHLPGLQGFEETGLVYYCTDAHAALPDVNSAEIARLDEALTRNADQVFVTSRALFESKKKLNRSTAYSPHGVDIAVFERASDPSCPLAEGARNFPHPVIGFFGLIGGWIDLDLIRSLARARPQWTFLLIGRIGVKLGELVRMRNVHFPGPQPYEALPYWAAAFDVAIQPFRQSDLVRNVNPLKLREYLATGKPVVSSPMPEVDVFAHCVRIATTPEEFLQQIEEALRSDSPQDRLRRQQAVQGMSWDARVREILGTVQRAGLLPRPLSSASEETSLASRCEGRRISLQ